RWIHSSQSAINFERRDARLKLDTLRQDDLENVACGDIVLRFAYGVFELLLWRGALDLQASLRHFGLGHLESFCELLLDRLDVRPRSGIRFSRILLAHIC